MKKKQMGDAGDETVREIARKQMGDAGEMLVAAQLSLHGIPAYTVPVNWPAYDVAADPPRRERQTISVKTRSLAKAAGVAWNADHRFDWLAVVLLPAATADFIKPRIFIIPRAALAAHAGRLSKKNLRGVRLNWIEKWFKIFEDNFALAGC